MDRLVAMEAYVRLVEAGTFSGAARQLRVGQPAVSKIIAQLEDRLGMRLLLRSRHKLVPTEAGRVFYERAKRAIEEADEAELAARGAGAALTGRLRVAAPLTFGRLQVVPRLPAFLTDHPALDLEMVLDDRDVDLIVAGIDVGLRLGQIADPNRAARKLSTARRIVAGTPAYFDAMGEPQTPADLLQHQVVIYGQRDGGQAWSFRKGTSEISVTVNGRFRTSAAEGVREAVHAGLGISIGGSEWLFGPELKSGAVKEVLTDWSLRPVELWAVFPTGRLTSAKTRAFVAFIEEQLSSDRFAGSSPINSPECHRLAADSEGPV